MFEWNQCFIQLGNTVLMTLISTIAAYIVGLPLGVLLACCNKKRRIIKNSGITYTLLSILVNVIRSIPCLIVVLICMPVTRAVFGKGTGSWVTILIPLFVASFAYVARVVEQSLLEVSSEKIEAVKSLGANNWQLVTKVLIPECRSSLILGCSVSAICILGYTSFAYDIGAGGLIAYIWTFYTHNTTTFINEWQFWIMIVFVVILVQVIQELGLILSKKLDKRRII